MSRSGVDKALYDIVADRQARAGFLSDADGFLDRYRLSPEERWAVGYVDLPVLLECGANPMLLWGMWMTFGDRSLSGYLSELDGNRTLSLRKEPDRG
ncbi:hypothetical protein [Actinomadura rupiterrae]|uniref:hypothetical protein n=1 Tax=Actinomadura rupiterrae TaxID=559627 RepID=UPI0020A5EB23|nr:hypothetical protein [Actinomadura rupiterrae]MCP2338680.1 hypothetical protein [Actinomadura rupiterrae]